MSSASSIGVTQLSRLRPGRDGQHEMSNSLPADVEVRRSTRRRKSVAAFREAGRTIIVVPERMSAAEVSRHAHQLLARLQARADKLTGDAALIARARLLRDRYLPGTPLPRSVVWSERQQSRWGSCTPTTESIRLSRRLRGMPQYVVDYVLVHELAHLVVADHGAAFIALVERYPHHQRAEAFLAGVTHAAAEFGAAGSVPDLGQR